LGLATRKEGENIRQTRKFFSTSNVEQKVI